MSKGSTKSPNEDRFSDGYTNKSLTLFFSKIYSSAENIKIWENEWGGKTFSSHGSTHGRGLMILFKPKIDVKIENSITDKNGRFLVEPIFDETKYIFFECSCAKRASTANSVPKGLVK